MSIWPFMPGCTICCQRKVLKGLLIRNCCSKKLDITPDTLVGSHIHAWCTCTCVYTSCIYIYLSSYLHVYISLYLWPHSWIPAQVVALPQLQFTDTGTWKEYLLNALSVEGISVHFQLRDGERQRVEDRRERERKERREGQRWRREDEG